MAEIEGITGAKRDDNAAACMCVCVCARVCACVRVCAEKIPRRPKSDFYVNFSAFFFTFQRYIMFLKLITHKQLRYNGANPHYHALHVVSHRTPQIWLYPTYPAISKPLRCVRRLVLVWGTMCMSKFRNSQLIRTRMGAETANSRAHGRAN